MIDEPLTPAPPRTAPHWADDPAEVAALWRHLDSQGWACDNGRRPDPYDFMTQAHRWAAEYNAMVAGEAAA